MKAILLAPALLLAGCGVGNAATPGTPTWRSSVAQAMSDLRPQPTQDQTCRQALRLSAGGDAVRLRLSNVLSPRPLALSSVTAGLRALGPTAVPGTLRPVTVGGARSFVIPAGAQVTTDPVALHVDEGQDLLVSFAVLGSARLSEHRFGAATGWCSGSGTGDLTGEQDGARFVVAGRAGLLVEDVAVATSRRAALSVVAAGDSLTDPPLPVDTFPRWTDVLAARLPGTPVVNAGIAGNRVVLPGGYGPTLVERFERDVLERPGIGTVVLLAGTNDLSAELSATHLRGWLTQLCRKAQARGLRVVLLTIPPALDRSRTERAARHEVNAWLRTAAPADLVVDADEVLRDPLFPERLAGPYDLGDGLHLSPLGHHALGKAVADALR